MKPPMPDRESLIEEIKAKQRNTVWPDAFVNSKGVDEFLWKGSPDAPLVQRVGAWIFGLTFILFGLIFVDIAYEKHFGLFGVLSIIWFLVGGKVFLNGFNKRRVKETSTD
jgi:hypothetical protein